MATTVRFVYRGNGVDQLLKGAKIRHELEERGRAVLTRAGGSAAGYGMETWLGRRRWRVTIRTATHDARLREATAPRLLAALGAGRR